MDSGNLGRFKSIFWPNLDSELELQDSARNGYYACLFVCLSTAVMMVLGGTLLAALLDIFFFLMAGLGVRQLSRLAAVSAMVLFLVERIVATFAGQVGLSSVVGVIVGAILFNAVRAAYAARELRPAGDLAALANPPLPATGDLAGWLDTLPWKLWPKLQMVFTFYLVGMSMMMLVGFVVTRYGVLE